MVKKKERNRLKDRKSIEDVSRSKKSASNRQAVWHAIEQWLADHQRHVLAAIVALSVLLRLIYFIEINNSPCLWQHRWDQTDMNFFDLWARDIATGDWLTNKVLHPYHGWHKAIADAYFSAHPEAAARVSAPDRAPNDPGRLVWGRWYGGKRFHQEPLYPYLVALTYKALGPDVRWVFAWQMVIGVLGNVLVYLIARRHFGSVVATAAGLLAVLCGPLLFYEMVLLRESLIPVAGLALLYLTDRALERGTWPWWLAAGIGMGVVILLKMTFATFCCGVLGLLVYRLRQTPQVLGRLAAALVGGIVLCLMPVIARNVAVGASPMGLSSVGAIGFVCANTEDYPPEVGSFITIKHAPHIMADTDGRLLPAMIETLKTHGSGGSYIQQLGRKFAVIWHWYELPDNNNFYYYGLHAAILRFLPVTFLILAPLAIVGLALAAPRLSSCVPLYLLVVTSIIPLLFFFVLSRYRVPLIAALIPFAGLALVQIVEWMWTRQVARSIMAITAVFIVALWTMRPLPAQRPLIRPVDYVVAYEVYYDRMVQQAIGGNDWKRAADILKDSLLYEPEEIQQIGRARPAMAEWESQLAPLFAGVHQRYAQMLRNSGQAEAALEQERRAVELMQAARANSSG